MTKRVRLLLNFGEEVRIDLFSDETWKLVSQPSQYLTDDHGKWDEDTAPKMLRLKTSNGTLQVVLLMWTFDKAETVTTGNIENHTGNGSDMATFAVEETEG